MSLTPVVAIHLTAALAAVVIGPVALWARRAGQPRARLHRAAGHAWVTLMVVTALSAVFISSPGGHHLAGFSAIHLLIPVVLLVLVHALRQLVRGNVRSHRRNMITLYVSACLVAGAFTLLPGRLLGRLVWGQWLGLA